MKKIILLSIVLVAGTVQAKYTNRSRNQALQFSPHILNFYSPENLNYYANTLTIETGSTTEGVTDLVNPPAVPALNQNAEGTLIKTFDFGTLGFTLGHQEDIVVSNRRDSAVVGIDGQQNPIQIGYGMKVSDLNVGAAVVYSNYNDKIVDAKESTMGLKAGVSTSLFYANAMLMFTDKYKTAAEDYKGDLGVQVNGGYFFNPDTGIHATVISKGFKEETSGAEETSLSAKVMVIDTVNSDAGQFFYGAGVLWGKDDDKAASVKTDILALPVIFGLEVNASSWATVRGSVSQNVILSKNGDQDPGLNTTTFAGGLGLNFDKISVDGAVTNSNNEYIGGKVSVTYMF